MDPKAFAYQHINIFRQYAISIAKEAGNADEAIRLIEEAIALNSSPHTNSKWYEQLKDLYKSKGDKTKLREATKQWYYCRTSDFTRYEEWKGLYGKDEQALWNKELDSLIKHLSKEGRTWYDGNRSLIDLFKREQMTKRLIDEVFKKPNLSLLQDYQPYIYPFVPEQYLKCYSELVQYHAQKNVNRSAYQELAKHLVYLAKMDKVALAQSLKEELLNAYKNRRAMKEELNKVRLE